MSEPVRGVVVGHAGMAMGMVEAVRCIAGVADDALIPLSNEGKSPDALCAELDRAMGGSRVVVFTDMQRGSCAVAARVACRSNGERAVVCGVNLPMLLDFVFNREQPLDQLVARLIERGRAAVTARPPHADPSVSS